MDFELPEFESGLSENLFYLGVCVVLIAGMAAADNLMTDDEDVKIGTVEVTYDCVGLDVAGMCIGTERPSHDTYNYANYSEAEPGSADYYRRVEAELMLQAYNICEDDSIEGMDWLSKAEYDNRTGEEWAEEEQVELLECSRTFRHQVDE